LNWWILLVLFLALLSVVGDAFLKLAGVTSKGAGWLVAGLFIYAVVSVAWYFVFQHVKLVTVGVYYSLATLLLLVGVGVLFFDERLNALEAVGVGAAVFALVVLGRFA
jgi:drug/metabolite transporter (DMT)-like permease